MIERKNYLPKINFGEKRVITSSRLINLRTNNSEKLHLELVLTTNKKEDFNKEIAKYHLAAFGRYLFTKLTYL